MFESVTLTEEVKGIPSPTGECNEEEKPLLKIQHSQKSEWVGQWGHRRLEGREPRAEISSRAHAFILRLVSNFSPELIDLGILAIVREVGHDERLSRKVYGEESVV